MGMSTGSGTVDGDQTLSHQTNPHTEITVRTMDPQEIEIGDRIRVDTEDSSNVLTPGTFITHTVDRIYYETANADSATPTQNGAIEKFTLNEIVSIELGLTGNTTKVDNSANRAIYNDQRGIESAHQKYIALVLMILFKGFEALYIGISCFSPAFCLIHKDQASFKTRSYALKVNLYKNQYIYLYN